MSKSVPDRWLQYTPYGKVIHNTKIIAFKVPLKESVSKNLQPDQQFTTVSLLKTFPNIKYVIDLTNTTRYYDKSEFLDAGVKYEKVMIPGHQVPPIEAVKRFYKAMENFTAACGEDEIIGVHCTHGVNRTGYLICRYLVQQLGWTHKHALKAFEEARGHAIERPTYVADVKRVPVGQKIDVNKVSLVVVPIKKTFPKNRNSMKHPGPRPPPFPMGPPGYPPPNRGRGFPNGAPFPPPPQFGFGGPPPGFGPMPPPQRTPGPRLMFGLRRRFGPAMPMRPPVPPPMAHPNIGGPRPARMPRMGPGPQAHGPWMGPGGPPRPPGIPIRLPGHPRIPGPPKRHQPPKMGPPMAPPINLRPRRDPHPPAKIVNDDFTADTFEENLASTPATIRRKRPYPGDK